MIKCLSCKRKFEQYDKQLVWDGVWVDCCPYCGTTKWDGKFRELKGKKKIEN